MSSLESPRTHRQAEELRRGVILTIRLTGPEHAQLLSGARSRNATLSAFGRSLLLRRIPPPTIDRTFAQELGRVGNNLNQIAHTLNRGLSPSARDIVEELQALRTLLVWVQKELRRDWQVEQGG